MNPNSYALLGYCLYQDWNWVKGVDPVDRQWPLCLDPLISRNLPESYILLFNIAVTIMIICDCSIRVSSGIWPECYLCDPEKSDTFYTDLLLLILFLIHSGAYHSRGTITGYICMVKNCYCTSLTDSLTYKFWLYYMQKCTQGWALLGPGWPNVGCALPMKIETNRYTLIEQSNILY